MLHMRLDQESGKCCVLPSLEEAGPEKAATPIIAYKD